MLQPFYSLRQKRSSIFTTAPIIPRIDRFIDIRKKLRTKLKIAPRLKVKGFPAKST